MADSQNNIPTLNDIAHLGKEDMLNHFNAHKFENETDEVKSSFTIENSSSMEDSEFNNIPSIKIDDNTNADLATDDFSESMQSAANKIPAKNPARKNINPEKLKAKIDQAIEDALSGIELQLKKQLYKQFDI